MARQFNLFACIRENNIWGTSATGARGPEQRHVSEYN